MKEIIGFFEEAINVKSVTRLAFFIMICQAVVVSSYMVITKQPVEDAIAFFTTVTGIATTLKLVQKGQEKSKLKK